MKIDKGFLGAKRRPRSIAARGRNARGGTRLRGSEVLGPLNRLGIRPLVSAMQSLGNPLLGGSLKPQGPWRGVFVFNGAGKQGGPLRGPWEIPFSGSNPRAPMLEPQITRDTRPSRGVLRICLWFFLCAFSAPYRCECVKGCDKWIVRCERKTVNSENKSDGVNLAFSLRKEKRELMQKTCRNSAWTEKSE